MKKIAVLLAGCGVFDGAEIHESVISLLAIKRLGHLYYCFAPDTPQREVVNHLNETNVAGERRNVLVEAARIARGDIKSLSELDTDSIDALIIPGGFGVAKTFFTFAIDGIDCTINESIKELIIDTHSKGKPIGVMCISPVLLVKAFQDTNVRITVTIGNVPELIEAINAFGGKHKICPVDDICIDKRNNIISAPAYTIAGDISEAAAGIDKLVEKVIELA